MCVHVWKYRADTVHIKWILFPFETLPDASLQNAKKCLWPPLVRGANTLSTLRIFDRLRPATIAIYILDLYARVSSEKWSVKNFNLQMAGTIHSTNSLVKIFV
jgi:hypothetical protein